MLIPDLRSRLGFVDGWAGHAERLALITDRDTITYGELATRVSANIELLGFARRLVLIELQTPCRRS
jgi:hypothetical protein